MTPTGTSAPAIESIPPEEEAPFDRGTPVGPTLRNYAEYREGPHGPWIKSEMSWSYDDIAFLNKAAGYARYRIVRAGVES